MCNTVLLHSRATFCSVACKQRAFRLRCRQAALPEVTAVRQQLKHQQQLVAHTVYECPEAGWSPVKWCSWAVAFPPRGAARAPIRLCCRHLRHVLLERVQHLPHRGLTEVVATD